MKPFIEKDCTFVFEGKSFISGGAYISKDYLIAYPHENGKLKDWHGNTLGIWWLLSWKPAIFFGRHSFYNSKYYYMRAKVNGIEYSLRGFGPGFIASGKAIKPK